MKKSELTQLTQIIEHLVAREVRKQLPGVIAEIFQNGTNKPVINEVKAPGTPAPVNEESEPEDFRASLKELFAGATPTGLHVPEPVVGHPSPAVRTTKQYTKNPVLNQILNETTGNLRSRERMVGAAAMAGGYSMMPAMGPGEMMPESDAGFMKGVPVMPGPSGASIPMGTPPPMIEGQESSHVPAGAIPEGISALDVARQVPLAAPVTKALTKNYSALMKAIDNKKQNKPFGT